MSKTETPPGHFLRAQPSIPRVAIEIPPDLVGELRSDHAGESGAVWIYHGVLAVTRDAGVRDFARRHRATEQRHLDLIEQLLPTSQRSRLLVPWRAAGFLTGALPALFGPRAVYATIAAVETSATSSMALRVSMKDRSTASE